MKALVYLGPGRKAVPATFTRQTRALKVIIEA